MGLACEQAPVGDSRVQSWTNGMNRERSGEEGVCVPLASLVESRRSDSHSLARRIFFRPGSLLAGYCGFCMEICFDVVVDEMNLEI